MNRLQEQYHTVIIPKLLDAIGQTNRLATPRLAKVVISTSFKEEQHQDEAIKTAATWMAALSGQKPRTTKAKKAIASFGIRAGDVVGLTVTLRRIHMWEFVDKLIAAALPRVKDFQGVPKGGFDGHGNYTLGITEQIIFPEVEYDTVGKVRGLQITFVTTAKDDRIGRLLLEELGMPFEKEDHGENK